MCSSPCERTAPGRQPAAGEKRQHEHEHEHEQQQEIVRTCIIPFTLAACASIFFSILRARSDLRSPPAAAAFSAALENAQST